MALDISAITSAVNKYLYSISDVNTLLTENGLSGADSSSNLSGIFEKYLTKAIENAAKTGSSTDLTESEVTSAMVSLSNGTTVDKTGIDKISNKDNMTDEEVAKALTSLKTLSTGLDTSTSSSLDGESMFSSSLPDLTGLGALSNLTSLNLEAEIEGAFAGVKNLDEQIKSKIANRDITGEINKSIENLDIKGDIQKSIANHDRSDEINSYNATRLKNYKKQASGTSVFGEYRL